MLEFKQFLNELTIDDAIAYSNEYDKLSYLDYRYGLDVLNWSGDTDYKLYRIKQKLESLLQE